MDEEPERTKRWEGGYERTWEILKEDESGSLKATIEDILFKAKRKRVFEHHGQVRLGMMRHLYVVVDGSRTMEDQDLKPNRLTCTLKLLEYFIEEYFDQNPISQIGIIVTKSKRAEKLTELSGNPRKHITSLKKAVDMTCHGEPSLYNSLSMAMQTLKHMPGHTSREVLVIFSSLTTCDPSNIYDLIKTLKAAKIRVSIIGLSAEVRVCTALARETGGTYHVILDESHFKELLTHHVSPPPASSNSECSLIRMGFPQHTIASLSDQDAKPSFSMAHLDSNTEPGLTLGGYFCPQCRAKYCELPVECKICGLTLVSAPHLARSYHHLFPLDAFQEIPLEEHNGESGKFIANAYEKTKSCEHRFCYACQGELKDQHVYVCSVCQNVFCVDCDVFVHDSLHCCPGCIHKIPVPSGKRDTVQCFSCAGCLGHWEDDDDPWKEHAKWFPKCEFLQSKKSLEEITQYIQSYKGFVDVTGEHFLNSWVKRDLSVASGKSDIVQCFSCRGYLHEWEEGDDPLEEHSKFFPNCQFIQSVKSSAEVIPDLQSHDELSELMYGFDFQQFVKCLEVLCFICSWRDTEHFLDLCVDIYLQNQLFISLDKFSCLKELSVNLQQDVFSIISEEFLNFHHMEKLLIQISSKCSPSKLVRLVQNSPNLQVFHLECNSFSDFESLVTALASRKKLEEIKFSGQLFEVNPFVIVLPNFISLKILNLGLRYIPDKETAEKFAYALRSLNNLEELILPTGDGIRQMAKLIVQQCQYLQYLQVLQFFQTLDDDSVVEIAKVAVNGGFQKLKHLNFSINHKITEEGYRNLFQTLDNLPNLQELTISRHFKECIKVQATTIKSLSQCVLRLPSLMTLNMLSWLLDAEDITLLNATIKKHPQSKHFTLSWKWILPFSPIIQEHTS